VLASTRETEALFCTGGPLGKAFTQNAHAHTMCKGSIPSYKMGSLVQRVFHVKVSFDGVLHARDIHPLHNLTSSYSNAGKLNSSLIPFVWFYEFLT
jgi:hypothetical protein